MHHLNNFLSQELLLVLRYLCFSDPVDWEKIQPFSAVNLEILVLLSDSLGLIFTAARLWIYMSKNRRRCKTAIMALQQLAEKQLRANCLPNRLFPASQLSSMTRLVKEVKIYYISVATLGRLIGHPEIINKKVVLNTQEPNRNLQE
jgi:hypothetical protein